ncbi:MAG: glycine cleavage system protein GcvH [Actinomycetales bacterium]|nr:glycine cleavage system protein GcvH [Actinomycetales bacterium]
MNQIPENLRYTVEHEWVTDDEPATVGITAVATAALGDIVFVELPEVGAAVTAGAVCGEIESTKSVSELYAPVSGTVVEVNEAVTADPAVVNADPYGAGWLFKVAVEERGALLTPAEYEAQAAG